MAMTLYPASTAAVPSYEQFRRHAQFSTDHADFVIYEQGLKQLLSELELLWGGASLGIGDLSVLMRSATGAQPAISAALAGPVAASVGPRWATYKPALTYQAAVHLCKALCERAARVRSSMSVPAAEVLHSHSTGLQQPPHHTDHQGTRNTVQPDLDLNHLLKLASQAVSPPPPVNMRMPSHRQVVDHEQHQAEQHSHTLDEAATAAASNQGHVPVGNWWDVEIPGRNPIHSQLPSRPQTAHPSLAQSTCGQTSQPPTGVLSIHATGKADESLNSSGPEPTGKDPVKLPIQWNKSSALLPQSFEPRLLYQVVRLPVCDFANVTRLLTGTKVLQAECQHVLVVSAIREVVATWEQAIADKAVNDSRKKGKSDADVVDTQSESPHVPDEAAVWALLVTGMSCLALHKQEVAEQLIQAAVELYQASALDEYHNYKAAVQLCQGIVSYHAGRFEEACSMFRDVHAAGVISGRATLDPIVLRNSAAAINNQGVALLQLGDRPGAVRCFGAAVDLLRHVPSRSSTPMILELAAMTAFESGRAGSKTSGSAAPDAGGSELKEPGAKKGKKSDSKAAQTAIAPPAGLDAPAAQIAMHNLQGALRYAFGVGPGAGHAHSAHFKQTAALAGTTSSTSTLHPLYVLRASRTQRAQGEAGDATLSSRPATAPVHTGARGAFADASLIRSRFQEVGQLGSTASSTLDASASQGAARQEPLKSFLTRAITLKPSPAPTAIPPYAQRVTAASMEGAGKGKGGKGKDAKKDGAGKKGKDGKKDGKKSKKQPKVFQVTWTSDYYDMPTYSLANVKAEAPKKKGSGKKKAK